MPTLRGEVTRPQVLIQPDPIATKGRVELVEQYNKPTPARVRALRKDPTIALARQLSVAPVLITPWGIEKTKDAPSDAVDFISSQMLPVRIHLLQKAFYGSIDFGYQPFEKVFSVNRHGFQVIVKYKPLLQDYTEILVVKSTGRFAGLRQTIDGDGLDLSQRKSLSLAVEIEGTNWYGESVMSILDSTQVNWTDVNSTADRFDKKIAGAHWVIHYPTGESEVNGVPKANDVIAQEILTALRSAGGVAIPNNVEGWLEELSKDAPRMWRIELISAGNNVQTTFIDRMKYLDALKVRAFGMPERAVLEGKFGTKAEAEAHADLALLNVEVKHQNIIGQLNWHVVNQLLRINYGEEAENTVFIVPAPIIDSRVAILKEIYSRILQSEDSLIQEVNALDMKALRDELNLPSLPEDSEKDITITENE